MQRTEDKGDKGKKAASDRDGSALAMDDAAAQVTDSSSADIKDSSPEAGKSPPATSSSSTALVHEAEHSASCSTQQLHTGPETELARGQGDKSKSILKKNLSLDLKSHSPSTIKLPVLSLEDESCPRMVIDPPPMLNVPSVSVDGTRCNLKSISTSEESLKTKDGKKIDNLDVHFSPGKRKTRTSPISDKYDSESNPDRYESTEKPRQKKSVPKRIMDREKSPLRKKAPVDSDDEDEIDKSPTYVKKNKSPKGSQSKLDKSPTCVKKNKSPKGSQSKLDKSPTCTKKNKSPKGSPNKLDKSPTRLREIITKSPSKLFGMVKGLFAKKDEESKHLFETEDSGEGENPPKKTTKEKPASKHLEGYAVTGDVKVVSDVNFSDTTCDSTSTKFSMTYISTDSPMSDTANPTGASDRTPKNPIQETKTSKSKPDDDGKMEEN